MRDGDVIHLNRTGLDVDALRGRQHLGVDDLDVAAGDKNRLGDDVGDAVVREVDGPGVDLDALLARIHHRGVGDRHDRAAIEEEALLTGVSEMAVDDAGDAAVDVDAVLGGEHLRRRDQDGAAVDLDALLSRVADRALGDGDIAALDVEAVPTIF